MSYLKTEKINAPAQCVGACLYITQCFPWFTPSEAMRPGLFVVLCTLSSPRSEWDLLIVRPTRGRLVAFNCYEDQCHGLPSFLGSGKEFKGTVALCNLKTRTFLGYLGHRQQEILQSTGLDYHQPPKLRWRGGMRVICPFSMESSSADSASVTVHWPFHVTLFTGANSLSAGSFMLLWQLVGLWSGSYFVQVH